MQCREQRNSFSESVIQTQNILGDPVKLEPIGEALRHNTIAILNGSTVPNENRERPFANTVETAHVARPIPARLGPPHTFFRLLP